MPTVKRKVSLNTTAVNVGCGSACRRINLFKLFHRKPNKHKHKHSRYYSDVDHHHHHSSSSVSASTSWSTTTNTTTTTTATLSPNASDTAAHDSNVVQGFGWLSGNSLAVEKDSNDPYVDFRESMLQMIRENEIYGKDDLRELLNCFLQLNSPYYHGIIVRAFTEIWNSLSI